jgi:signal transduction histidine kinase
MNPHGRRANGWHASPWQEEFIAEYEPRYRLPAAARLWIPVVLSFMAQVPASIVLWRTRGFFFLDNGSAAQFALGVGIALIGPLALIAARRFPGPVVAIVSAAAAVDLFMGDSHFGPPYLALAFAIGGAVVRGARIWAWISVGVAWIFTITLGAIAGADLQPGRIAGTTLGILIVFGIAESMRGRRERIAILRSRVAARKQTEVQAERVRIARELHDVLAHSLSQINVQAGVGLHLIDRQPEKAAEALASIKETSKQALDEVRSVLGVLRAEGGADPSAPLVPEPDLSRLAGLAASVTSQGVDVSLSNELADVPGPVQLALYRIVQESLTNVVRHANATRATVQLDEADDAYRVSISDNGAGHSAASAAEGGRGLLGMRERAELLGGHLTAGPAESGFTVFATIPRTEHA